VPGRIWSSLAHLLDNDTVVHGIDPGEYGNHCRSVCRRQLRVEAGVGREVLVGAVEREVAGCVCRGVEKRGIAAGLKICDSRAGSRIGGRITDVVVEDEPC